MQAIDLISLTAPKTQISICSIIMEPTLTGMLELAEWVQQNEKVDLLYLMVLMQANNTQEDPLWYEKEMNYLWPKDYEKVSYVLDKLIDFKQKGYKICNPVKHLTAYKDYFKNPKKFVKKNACHINQAVHISAASMCLTQLAQLTCSSFS